MACAKCICLPEIGIADIDLTETTGTGLCTPIHFRGFSACVFMRLTNHLFPYITINSLIVYYMNRKSGADAAGISIKAHVLLFVPVISPLILGNGKGN